MFFEEKYTLNELLLAFFHSKDKLSYKILYTEIVNNLCSFSSDAFGDSHKQSPARAAVVILCLQQYEMNTPLIHSLFGACFIASLCCVFACQRSYNTTRSTRLTVL